jgi:predicted methyltransferase
MKLTIFNDVGEEIEIPAKYVVCDRCEGKGTHTNPSIDGNGLCGDDIDRLGGAEFLEEYQRGDYDVWCEKCGGKNVTLAPDFEAMSPELEEQVKDYYDDAAACDAEQAAEMRAEHFAECRLLGIDPYS